MPGSFPDGKLYTMTIVKAMNPETVLDVGPGVGTYSDLFRHYEIPIERFDAVEIWEPYITKYQLEKKYTNVHKADIREWENFDYDLVVLGDILEHMSKEDAVALWERIGKQAKYAIISIPIVHLPQGEEEGNPYEAHVKDDWTVEEVLDTFPHIGRYSVGTALGVFIADFTYDGPVTEDKDLYQTFPENPDAAGGTEYMARGFRTKILPDLPKFQNYRCIILPGWTPKEAVLFDGTPTILWMHIIPTQISEDAMMVLKSKVFQSFVAYVVCVSEWHRQQIIEHMGMDPAKVVVIQNALDPIEFDPNRFKNVDTVQIIHASSPDRAMEVLIPAVHSIDRSLPFELKVFNTYDPDTSPIGIDIAHIVNDDRITYYNRTPHRTVLKYMAQAHIHAYPAAWEETSCIAQIEALSAGCMTVVSDIAALPETSMGHGIIVPRTFDLQKDIDNFASALCSAIKVVRSGSWEPSAQAKQIYDFFSWERAKERWTEFHEQI
jgi:glycosyltransferase involved in cell wall biosynthesis